MSDNSAAGTSAKQNVTTEAPQPTPSAVPAAQTQTSTEQNASTQQLWIPGLTPHQYFELNRRLAALPLWVQHVIRTQHAPHIRTQIVGNSAYLNQYVQNLVATAQKTFPNFNPLQFGIGTKPQAPVHSHPVRHRHAKRDEIERLPELQSSDEAEFTDSDFEKLEDDYVLNDLQRTNVQMRDRKKVNYGESESEEEEETLMENGEEGMEFIEKIERLYMSRVTEDGLEYLVKFQDSQQGICQWIPESLMQDIPNGKAHLARFRKDPFDIEQISTVPDGMVYPIAHRRESEDAKPELLFRMSFDSNILFFWDMADDETERNYFEGRMRIDLNDVTLPPEDAELEEPTLDLVHKDDGVHLREYQLQGINWMIKCWRDGHGSILADEMGLGKTIQILGFITYLNKYTDWHGPFLVVVRANTFKQWCDEIEQWTEMSYIAYQGMPGSRAIIREHELPALDDDGNVIPNALAFNIFLVTYDVLLKDIEFLQDIEWKVLVLDEGHRIKNSQGKKNNLFRSMKAKHRIILTGTPIQNNLVELWALLMFVSPQHFTEMPEWVATEMEDLTDEMVMEVRELIKPHMLHRSVAGVEHSIAPKEERVVFVGLTDVQRDLIRLIKLGKVWRLKGIQQSAGQDDEEVSGEQHLLFRVCSHPFLVKEAEQYYRKKLGIKNRAELLMSVSVKFQWLDRILKVLHAGGHRVLIFSQRVETLRLLDEFVGLKGYSREILVGQMTDAEKNNAIDNYRRTKAFVFLISTRAGSEGLNLTEADTAIIFDPDWNPQNDIQAQARCHRIGQTKKVDVIRLCTFQTYEHEIFVRAQRKLGLWEAILDARDVADVRTTNTTGEVIDAPPVIDMSLTLPDTLIEVLHQTSTVVDDFSLERLPVLESSLVSETADVYEQSDEEFIESFPVVVEGTGIRAARSRSREFNINAKMGEYFFEKMKKDGFGNWDIIAFENEGNYPMEQVRRFCLTITLLSFRALKPGLLTYLPVLTLKLKNELDEEEIGFRYEDLICTNNRLWAVPYEDDHDLSQETEACRKIKSLIKEDPLGYLSVLEMRLIGSCWMNASFSPEMFKWENVSPPYTEADRALFNAIIESDEFDPFSERVQAIINVMRADIITTGVNEAVAYNIPFWTDIEFNNVVTALQAAPFDKDNVTEFHALTTVTSKDATTVMAMGETIMRLLKKRSRGSTIKIPKKVSCIDEIPKSIMRNSMVQWTTVSSKLCQQIMDRQKLVTLIQAMIINLGPLEPTEEFGDYHTQKFLELVLKFGADHMLNILIDERYGFTQFMTESDIDFCHGRYKKRNLRETGLPDYMFNEKDLLIFLGGDQEPVKKTRKKNVLKRSRKASESDFAGSDIDMSD